MPGKQAPAGLEVRPTRFTTVCVARLTKVKTMTYGGAVSLAGRARGTEAVSLEAKPYGLDWAPAGELLLDGNGRFSTIVRPQIGTQYRLAWGSVRAGLAKIAVAVRVDATITRADASGTTVPPVSNAAVELQWSADGKTDWQSVQTASTDASGAFALSAPSPTDGLYRVRVAPGRGLAPGLSKTSCC